MSKIITRKGKKYSEVKINQIDFLNNGKMVDLSGKGTVEFTFDNNNREIDDEGR